MVVAVGQEPNDLRDQRDLLIDEIADLRNVAVSRDAGQRQGLGRDRQRSCWWTAPPTRSTRSPIDAAGAATVNGIATTISSGSLRGLVDLRDSVIGGATGYIAQLDTLAAAVAASVNARHAAGFGLDGSTGNAFFTGHHRGDPRASRRRSPPRWTRSRPATPPAAVPGGAGQRHRDGAAPVRGADHRRLHHDASTASTSRWSPRSASTRTRRPASPRCSRASSPPPSARRDGVSGVNLDEEMSDMVRFQKSYNAAARMITTLDEMLETIIPGMGVVGR